MSEMSHKAGSAISWYGSSYYNECHALFRSLTDQPQRMLKDIRGVCDGRRCRRILSIGSGTGLFEIPMLELLLGDGFDVRYFVGIDINLEACKQLARRLEGAEFNGLEWRVLSQDFEDYPPVERFHVVIFNHSLEYLAGPAARWVMKALRLLREDGICLIYSPDRGGINAPYEEFAQEIYGLAPRFSDDLKRSMDAEGIRFTMRRIMGKCSVEPLQRSGREEDRIRLLSFLAQIDCRKVGREKRATMSDYYLGLRDGSEPLIPHPTTRFLIARPGHDAPGDSS